MRRNGYIGGYFFSRFWSAADPTTRFAVLFQFLGEFFGFFDRPSLDSFDIRRGRALERVVFEEFILPAYPSAQHFSDDEPPRMGSEFLGGHLDAADFETMTLFEIKCPRRPVLPPRPEWVLQTAFYAVVLGVPFEKAFIVQLDYDLFSPVFYEVLITDELRELISSRAEQLSALLKKYKDLSFSDVLSLYQQLSLDEDVKALALPPPIECATAGVLDEFDRIDRSFRYFAALRRNAFESMKNKILYSGKTSLFLNKEGYRYD